MEERILCREVYTSDLEDMGVNLCKLIERVSFKKRRRELHL